MKTTFTRHQLLRLAIEHAVRPGEAESASATRIQVRGMNSPGILVNMKSALLEADGCIALPRSF